MKKQILSENEIRRMMKFANIQPLTNKFLQENITEDDAAEEKAEDAEDQPEIAVEALEAEEEEMEVSELPVDEPLQSDDVAVVDTDDSLETAVDAALLDKVKELAAGFAELVSDVMGVEVTAEMPEEEVDVDVAVDDEEVALEPGGEVEVGEEETEEEEEVEVPLEEAGIELEESTEDEIVNEVTRRVAKRLMSLTENKHTKKK